MKIIYSSVKGNVSTIISFAKTKIYISLQCSNTHEGTYINN